MACGCQGKTTKYLVVTRAGVKHTVDSLTAAINLVRAEGGTYQRISVPK